MPARLPARQDALASGASTYEGKPCKHHPDIRTKRTVNGTCVACGAASRAILRPKYYARSAQKRREERTFDPTHIREKEREYYRTQLPRAMFKKAKERAKKKGLAFEITLDDVIIPMYCPIFKTKFEHGTIHSHEFAATLERVDNSKGYVKGNVIVVSWRANRLKSDASLTELKQLVEFYSTLADALPA